MFNSLNFKVILFGFIFTFFSSFGQSFFLGLFNPSIRETLSISHGQFGTIYASATLLSSFVLVLVFCLVLFPCFLGASWCPWALFWHPWALFWRPWVPSQKNYALGTNCERIWGSSRTSF